MKVNLESILNFCRERRSQFGDSALGMGWSSVDEETVRHQVMLDLIRTNDIGASLLDFGCGSGRLLKTILNCRPDLRYKGLDISEEAIELAKLTYPDYTFECCNILDPPNQESDTFDYIVMNGVFTYRGSIANEAMVQYSQELIKALFARVRIGMAFNFMSKHVDWERDDLFHMPMDALLNFLAREVTRHVVIRHDYGLYEYTVFAYRDACDKGMRNTRQRLV